MGLQRAIVRFENANTSRGRKVSEIGARGRDREPVSVKLVVTTFV